MSSKRRLRRKSCEGKKGYATSAEALGSAISLTKRKGEVTHVYKCNFCKKYHKGHKTKRIRNAIAAKRGASKL